MRPPVRLSSSSPPPVSLSPLERGLSFFHEGFSAFLVVLAFEAFLHPRLALRGVVRRFHDLADDALRRAHGQRRVGGDDAAGFFEFFLKVFFCRYFMNQP